MVVVEDQIMDQVVVEELVLLVLMHLLPMLLVLVV